MRAMARPRPGSTPSSLSSSGRTESRPLFRLPVKPLAPSDGWVDDPADANYNRPVSLPYPASAEQMWREDDLYDALGRHRLQHGAGRSRRRECDFPPYSNTGFRSDCGVCRRRERNPARAVAAVGSGQQDRDHGLRRIGPPNGGSRAGSKAERSTERAAPSIISSAIASPVAGALRIPQTLWPVAM